MPLGGWPKRDSPEALRLALDKCHDNVRQLLRENDRLRKALLELNQQQTFWVKVLVTASGVLATGVGSIFAWLIPYAIRGMAH